MAFVTTSPDGEFRVEITGNVEPSRRLLREHLVEAVVSDGSGGLFARVYLHQAGLFDDGFAHRFRDPVWTDPRLLLFPIRAPDDELLKDLVVLRNESGQALRCVRLHLADLALLLDVRDRSQHALRLSRPRGLGLEGLGVIAWRQATEPSVDVMRLVDVPRDRPVTWTVVLKPDAGVDVQYRPGLPPD